MYDIAIIGGGIIGSFLAWDLSKYKLKTILLEKESDIANGATMANSAIIHSGHDPEEGTLKAKLNVQGNRMYEAICKELSVDFVRTSAFVAAVSKEEEIILEKLYRQSVQREIPAVYLSGDEARRKEPNLSDDVTAVIELPSTGVIYPWETVIALAEEAVLNGVEIRLNHKVTGIKRMKDSFRIFTEESTENIEKVENREIEAKLIINAAGVFADEIYQMVSKRRQFSITARRGEYYVLDRMHKPLVERVIYPVPSKEGKGVLAVPTTHGNVLLGPNSQFVQDKTEEKNTPEGLETVRRNLEKTIKNIPMNKVIRIFAGLRPTGDQEDFIIEEAEDVKGFIQAACIESPGLASAPAISRYIIDEILADKVSFEKKSERIHRKPPVNLKRMSKEERAEIVKKDPSFARIVCRCEQISEGEIIDIIHRPLGAKTVKGVKKRIRPGMGRCQGGFCEPLVMGILARELTLSHLDICLDGKGSEILAGRTKDTMREDI